MHTQKLHFNLFGGKPHMGIDQTGRPSLCVSTLTMELTEYACETLIDRQGATQDYQRFIEALKREMATRVASDLLNLMTFTVVDIRDVGSHILSQKALRATIFSNIGENTEEHFLNMVQDKDSHICHLNDVNYTQVKTIDSQKVLIEALQNTNEVLGNKIYFLASIGTIVLTYILTLS